jgi:uncharacterized protein
MKPAFWYPVAGYGLAIALTTSLDANGLTVFSALPLFPLALTFWALQRFTPGAIGFAPGRLGDYGVAILYPLIVLSLAVAAAFATAAAHPQNVPSNFVVRLVVAIGAGFVIGLLTEELFFRGWLWAALRHAGLRGGLLLAASSFAFALWHLSYATLAKGYALPPLQCSLYIVNAAIIGATWGFMRAMSGSLLIPSVSHAVWNAFAYALFGEGPKIGWLGITQTFVYGPEVGLVGLVLNAMFLVVLLLLRRNDLR